MAPERMDTEMEEPYTILRRAYTKSEIVYRLTMPLGMVEQLQHMAGGVGQMGFTRSYTTLIKAYTKLLKLYKRRIRRYTRGFCSYTIFRSFKILTVKTYIKMQFSS